MLKTTIFRLPESKKHLIAKFWRIGDIRICKEWLAVTLGGMMLLVYLYVLFFETRPRK